MVHLFRLPPSAAVAAATTLGPSVEVGAVLRVRGRLAGVGASGARAAVCDTTAVRYVAGPCVEACESLRGLMVTDLDVDVEERWTRWRASATACGVRSTLTLAAAVDGATEIALTAYGRSPGVWPREAIAALDRHTQAVAFALRLALDASSASDDGRACDGDTDDLCDDSARAPGRIGRVAPPVDGFLRTGARDAALADHALAAIMRSDGCDARDGLVLLVGAASGRAVSVADVALTVLTTMDGGRADGRVQPQVDAPVRRG